MGTDRPLVFVTIRQRLLSKLDQRGAVHGGLPRLDRLAEAWERINAAARDAETYNLERKPLVFSVFGLLAEATRG
jgi:DNA polymerase-3 subunit delta'